MVVVDPTGTELATFTAYVAAGPLPEPTKIETRSFYAPRVVFLFTYVEFQSWQMHHRLLLGSRRIGRCQAHSRRRRFGSGSSVSARSNAPCRTRTPGFDWEKCPLCRSRQFVKCPNRYTDRPNNQKRSDPQTNYWAKHRSCRHWSIHRDKLPTNARF